MTVASPVAAEPATASQQARRERILQAATDLATEGGYSAVAMRDVAERAGVALGTLYRYFPSKDALLVALLGETFSRLREGARLDREPAAAAERITRVVEVMTRFVARNRRLSGAMIRALMSGDAATATQVDAVGGLMVGFIASAIETTGHEPTAGDTLIALIIGKVWLADVIALLAGRMTLAQVLDDLQDSIRLVTGAAAPPATSG